MMKAVTRVRCVRRSSEAWAGSFLGEQVPAGPARGEFERLFSNRASAIEFHFETSRLNAIRGACAMVGEPKDVNCYVRRSWSVLTRLRGTLVGYAVQEGSTPPEWLRFPTLGYADVLTHAKVFGDFQRRSADAADDGRAVATGKWIGHLATASGAVEQSMRFAVGRLLGSLSHGIQGL
jgi:hypothetical protein